jgi:predicted permease
MKSGGRGLAGSRDRFSIQKVMVVVQISVSLVLLVGALLFVHSFRNLMTLDPGMRENATILAFVGFGDSKVPPQRYEEFKRDLLEEVRSVPGVIDAATTTTVPLLGGSWTHNISIGSSEGPSKFVWVSPDYFKTMGIPIRSGRGLNANDTGTSPRVALVNQAFVKQFLGGANPIGQTLRTGPEPQYPSTVYEIVGVVPDTKYSCLACGIPPQTFAAASQSPNQHPWTWMMIHGDPSLAVAIKRRIAEKHPEIVIQPSDFQQDIRDGMVRERLLAMLSGFFGFLAALLAMVGLYGVMSYSVARRRSEIGIRVALGAARKQVVGMVMREAAYLMFIGVVIGSILSLLAGRSAGSLLFGLNSYDPLTLLVSVVLLGLIATTASLLPARRASKVDPMVALRYE